MNKATLVYLQYLLGIAYTWNKVTLLAVRTRNRLHLQYLLGIGYTCSIY